MLSVNHVTFALNGKHILKNFDFQLKLGEIATLVGASGSGKTTAFKLITGLIQPDSGSILILDQIPGSNDHLTYMTQEDLLLPWKTVIGNLLLITEIGKSRFFYEETREKAQELLQEVGLSAYADKYPHELSGGLRQLVALTRAFLHDRPLLLLDEPFNAIDLHVREHLYNKLRSLRTRYKKTIFLVTHDFHDAITVSDRIFLLAEGSIAREWVIAEEDRKDRRRLDYMHQEIQQAISTYHPFLMQPILTLSFRGNHAI